MRSALKDTGQRQRIVSGYANGGAGNVSGFSNGVAWTSTRDSAGLYTLKLSPPPGLTFVSIVTTVASGVAGYGSQAVGAGVTNTLNVRVYGTGSLAMTDANWYFTATFREDLI